MYICNSLYNQNNYMKNQKCYNNLEQNKRNVQFGDNKLKLSTEMRKALDAKTTPYVKDYIENFADLSSVIFKTNPREDVIKTLQMILDKLLQNDISDIFLKNKYIEILYSGISTHTGIGKELKSSSISKGLTSLEDLTSTSKKMITDIIKEVSDK